MKWVMLAVWSALCLGFSLIPETAMYFLWQLVNPSTQLEKIAVLALFWLGGVGLCLVFAFLGLTVWIAGLNALDDTYRF